MLTSPIQLILKINPMSRKVIIVLLVFAFIVIAAFVVWKWAFKKSDISVSSEKATTEIEAAVLTHEFEKDEEACNAKYIGKVITVYGVVNSITSDEQYATIYLKNEEDISGVMCSFNKDVLEVNSVQKGNRVKIKGVCTGYLMDVQMTKCSLEL